MRSTSLALFALLSLVGCQDPPQIIIQTVPPAGNDVSFTTAFDIDEGSALDLVVETGKAGAVVTTSALPKNAKLEDGVFSFTPDYTQADLYSITFTITAGDTITTKTIGIRVLNVIHINAPALTTVLEGSPAPEVPFASMDPAGTIVTLTADLSAAPGATFDPTTGKLKFTPTFRWLDSRASTLAIIVTAEGQELDTGRDRVSSAKVVYQINEATSFSDELVPLFKMPPGSLTTIGTTPSPSALANLVSDEGHNCVNCHDGSPSALAQMDFTPDHIYTTLVGADPLSPNAFSSACEQEVPLGVKRVLPNDPSKSLWYMKISGTDGAGNPNPPCGVQMPENQDVNYWTVTDQDKWYACPVGVTKCHTDLNCANSDVACKENARLVRKARLWILAGAPNN